MRIACLVENLSSFGGTQKQFLRIAEHFHFQGHETELFVDKFDEKYALGLEKILRVNVAACGPKKSKKEFLAEFVAKTGSRLKTFDWILVSDGDLVDLKLHLKGPKICWICNDAPFSHKAFVYGHGLKFRIRHALQRALFFLSPHKGVELVDKIIVLDSKMQSAVKRIYNKHAEVIRSGIDLPEESATSAGANEGVLDKYGVQKSQYVVAIGIAYPMRNFEVLIRSASLIAALKVVIIAPDRYDKFYFNKIKQLAAPYANIIVNGQFISEEEKTTLLRCSAMFVFPNKDQTWGLAPLEAGSVKIPVIVSNECGVTEVLTHKKTAMLFDPNDHEALAHHINTLHSDTVNAKMIGENLYKLIISDLNWPTYATNIVNYLKRES